VCFDTPQCLVWGLDTARERITIFLRDQTLSAHTLVNCGPLDSGICFKDVCTAQMFSQTYILIRPALDRSELNEHSKLGRNQKNKYLLKSIFKCDRDILTLSEGVSTH